MTPLQDIKTTTDRATGWQRPTVWRFFQRHTITFKKSLARGGAGARRRGARPAALDASAGLV
jgi:hypothetical protein